MWIVNIALKRPYTFIVMALLILLISPLVILRTPTDIFPNIDIPVIAALWNYPGLSAEEMEERIASPYERSLTTVVTDIDHIESQTVNGRSIIKVFFHPGTRVDLAMAQMTAVAQNAIHQMPPGTQSPFMLVYSASSVPILQLALSGQGLSEQQLFDYAANFIRTQLATVPGAAIPWPYGGKQRQVMIDLQPALLQSKGLSPADVVNAVEHPEPDSARRHFEDRPVRIRRRPECQPRDRSRSSTIFRSRRSATAPSMCATWRTCATAFRRRPTSSAAMASAARCSPS